MHKTEKDNRNTQQKDKQTIPSWLINFCDGHGLFNDRILERKNIQIFTHLICTFDCYLHDNANQKNTHFQNSNPMTSLVTRTNEFIIDICIKAKKSNGYSTASTNFLIDVHRIHTFDK